MSFPHNHIHEDEYAYEDRATSWASKHLKTLVTSDVEANSILVNPVFNEEANFGSVHLELGMEFTSLDAFKKGVREYAIHLGKMIKWVKNDKGRTRAKFCKNESGS